MTTDTELVAPSDSGAEVVSRRRSTLRYVSVAAAAAPALLIIALVVRYWTNVPFWDEWELVSIISAYHHGTLSFADFYAQHNEHRILIPNLVRFGLAQASGWDTRWEMAFSLLVALVTFGLLALMLRRGLRTGWVVAVATPLASLVLFSPVQYENWLWGFEIAWFMMVLGVVGALCALGMWKSAPSWKPIAVAMAAATLATYSLGSGMLVWAVCLPVLLVDRRLRRWTPVWVILGAVEIALYFTDYQTLGGQDDTAAILRHPAAFGHYMSMYLARPLVPVSSCCSPTTFQWHESEFVTGCLLLVLAAAFGYLAVRRRADLVVALPWFCLAGYTVLAGSITASSRLDLGLQQAAASRYTAISNLFIVSTIAVVCIVLGGTWRRREAPAGDGGGDWVAARPVPVLSAVVLVLIGALALANYRPGFKDLRQDGLGRKDVLACALHAVGPDDPCLAELYPDTKVAWDRVQYLRSIHMGGL
jgi:hypothetical protein